MIFTTKNKELAIFGKTLSETREKLIAFFEAFERGGVKGQDRIIDTFFLKNKKSPLTPELLAVFEKFKDEFNSTSLSAEALKEKFREVDQRIIDYAKTCKNGEMTTEGFKASIDTMSFSAKAGKVALQALAMVGNMIAGFFIAKAFQVAVTAIDNYIHRVEKANEAMNNAIDEYESAKSSLESVNSELEEQNKQIDDLLAKDKLSYAEKEQLEELQAITKELLLQQDIEEKRAETASKEAADKAVDAYNKQYARYDSSRDDLDKKLSYENFYLPEDEDDVLGNIAAYVKATEALSEAQKKYQNALKNGEDITWLADDVQYSIDSVNDLSQALDDNLSDLQEKRLALEEEYNKAIEKRKKDIEPLTSSEQDIITTYESIYDTMKMVYEYTNQNDWNNMEIENIFNTEGLEKTKEELAEMAKSGELTPETIASYKNLNAAIQDSELFLKNGQTATEAFCEQIKALNDAINYDNVRKQFMSSLGFGDTIDSASEAQLWNEISSLGEEELVLEQNAISEALYQSNYYTDTKISDLINGAPETLDTLKEIADAIEKNDTIIETLNEAIGNKANKSELDKYLPLTGGTVTNKDDISVIKMFSDFLVNGSRKIGGFLIGANNEELVRVQSEKVNNQVDFWIQDRILTKDIFKVSSKEHKIYSDGQLKDIMLYGDKAFALELPRIDNGDANYKPGKDIFEVKEFGSGCSNIPTENWYHIITMQGNDVREEYVTQFAVGMTVDALYYRRFHGSTWEDWSKIVLDNSDIGNCTVNGKKINEQLTNNNNSITYSDSQPTILTSGMTWIGN